MICFNNLEIEAIYGLLAINSLKKSKRSKIKVKKTQLQQNVLSRIYSITRLPSTKTRNDIALLIGISPRSVQVWFQNRRQCDKSNNKNDFNDDISDISSNELFYIVINCKKKCFY